MPQQVITVKYFGMLRELAGKREDKIIMDGSQSMSELIGVISGKQGQKFNDLVFDSRGKLREGFAFAIDGESVTEAKLSRTKCKDVSEFVILPPISGGGERKHKRERSTMQF